MNLISRNHTRTRNDYFGWITLNDRVGSITTQIFNLYQMQRKSDFSVSVVLVLYCLILPLLITAIFYPSIFQSWICRGQKKVLSLCRSTSPGNGVCERCCRERPTIHARSKQDFESCVSMVEVRYRSRLLFFKGSQFFVSVLSFISQ